MLPGYGPLFIDFSRMAEVKPSSCPAYTSTFKSRMRRHRRLRTSRPAHDRQAVTPCHRRRLAGHASADDLTWDGVNLR